MKYETIGGQVKDTEYNRQILRFLKYGDRFTDKNHKGKWEVIGEKCDFNPSAGSSTRKCRNLKTGLTEHKLCRIEVIKI